MQEIQYKEPVMSPPEVAELPRSFENFRLYKQIPAGELSYGNYCVRYARTAQEVRKALNLQYQVFNLELNNDFIAPTFESTGGELLPTNCLYLIVLEKTGGQVVGTYRICTLEMAGKVGNFFSAQEFLLEELPADIPAQAIEISRLCILPEHRNKQVLFLLWKFLADHLMKTGKRFLFGCCSIFSQDHREAVAAFDKLNRDGYFHPAVSVTPQPEYMFTEAEKRSAGFSGEIVLPKLFGSYLKVGALICSQPAIDRQFRTVDFFMLFDVRSMNEKYYRMFFT